MTEGSVSIPYIAVVRATELEDLAHDDGMRVEGPLFVPAASPYNVIDLSTVALQSANAELAELIDVFWRYKKNLAQQESLGQEDAAHYSWGEAFKIAGEIEARVKAAKNMLGGVVASLS